MTVIGRIFGRFLVDFVVFFGIVLVDFVGFVRRGLLWFVVGFLGVVLFVGLG